MQWLSVCSCHFLLINVCGCYRTNDRMQVLHKELGDKAWVTTSPEVVKRKGKNTLQMLPLSPEQGVQERCMEAQVSCAWYRVPSLNPRPQVVFTLIFCFSRYKQLWAMQIMPRELCVGFYLLSPWRWQRWFWDQEFLHSLIKGLVDFYLGYLSPTPKAVIRKRPLPVTICVFNLRWGKKPTSFLS